MARYLFASALVELPGNIVAAGIPFSLWSELHGGTQYTDIKAPDGVTSIPLVMDGNGVRPELRGPDSVKTMYCDAGGGVRFEMYATDELSYILDQFRVLAFQFGQLATQVDNLDLSGGGTGGGGLPVGTTLDQIPNGADRLAMTYAERNRIAGLPSSFLQLGTTAGTAKAGNYKPTPAEISAVQNVNGAPRLWGRSASQALPTAAEGAVDGDWLFRENP